MKNWNWNQWMIGLAATLALGCGTNDAQEKLAPLEQIQAGLYLEKAESCEDLESYLKNLHLESMKNMLMNDGGYGAPVSIGLSEPGMDIAAAPPQAASAGGEGAGAEESFDGGTSNTGGAAPAKGIDIGENYTGTNNQEVTVDEADIVKTDGEHIFILRNSSLLITTAWPADDIEVVSSTAIEGNPLQMFVQDDTLVVFSNIWDTWSVDAQLGTSLGEKNIWDLTKVSLFNIADKAEPKLAREMFVDGNFQSARLVGQTARVVISSQIRMNEDMGYSGGEGVSIGGGATIQPAIGVSEPSSPPEETMVDEAPTPEEEPVDETDDMPEEEEAGKADLMIVIETGSADETINAANAEEAMALLQLQAYKEMIDAQTLDTMLPAVVEVIHNADGTTSITEGLLTECENHYKPAVDAGMNLLSVVTLDMGAPSEKRPASTVIGEAGIVYSSANAMYIASNIFTGWFQNVPGTDEDYMVTAIHKFDIASSGDEALYRGTGTIKGSVLNQFSMSEFEGNLRVAHTRDNWSVGESENLVSVLAEGTDGQLETIGSLDGLAPGERIYSARFMGEKGYVVTFETVDPLFTIDLSEPTNPTLVGELKIPGFSTYIHPLGDNHLLTIGQHTVANEWGGFSIDGIQLTVFDVSDFAAPEQAHKVVLEGNAWSSAVYDSKAFTFHAGSGLLALPLSAYGTVMWEGDMDTEEKAYEQTIGLSLYSVDAELGIDDFGFVDHASFLEESQYGWEEVRRSLIMGDHVYSIGNLGMKVATQDTVEEVSSTLFPQEPAGNSWGDFEEGFGGETMGSEDREDVPVEFIEEEDQG
jgi:uncharacterized secreted protein with C-terminal beta-propeller domain